MMNETQALRADEVTEGSSVHTSAGWCLVLVAHEMPKTVRLDLSTPTGLRSITPRREDVLTVQLRPVPEMRPLEPKPAPRGSEQPRLFEPQMEGQLCLDA